MSKRIDSFLTGEINDELEDALVIVYDENTNNEMWVLELDDEEIELGINFKAARRALEQYKKVVVRKKLKQDGGDDSRWKEIKIK